MRKIPTLFVRERPTVGAAGPFGLIPELTPGLEWVLLGQGRPTRKWDGTAVMLDVRGRWWARREVKLGKPEPFNFRPVQRDAVTGNAYGWVPIEQSSYASAANEAIRLVGVPRPGTFELIGPKVNRNPEGAPGHVLVRHGDSVLRPLDGVIYPDALTAYEQLRGYLASVPEIEGVVWHHPDGRMAKLKGRDFPSDDPSPS